MNMKGIFVIAVILSLFVIPGIVSADEDRLLICRAGGYDCIDKWNSTNLSFIASYGSVGNGDDEFDNPQALWNDGSYVYIADTSNHRIKKHLISSFELISQIGSAGSGNDQFQAPKGITGDDTFIYVSDNGNSRIKKHYKSNLTYHSQFGSFGAGDNQFHYPYGIDCDDTYLYISDKGNSRIKKHLKSDLTFVSKYGSFGSANEEFNEPHGITVHENFVYITDRTNRRLKKHNKADLTYHSLIGSAGSGDDQFNYPANIDNDGTFVYIADSSNNRIKTHLMSDLSYHNQTAINSIYAVSYYVRTVASGHECFGADLNLIDYPTAYFNFTISSPQDSVYQYCFWMVDLKLGEIWGFREIDPTETSVLIDTTGEEGRTGYQKAIIGYWNIANGCYDGNLCFDESCITPCIGEQNAYFVADTGNDRIKAHSTSASNNYPLIAQFGSSGLGNDQFDYPVCVRTYGDYIYVLDQGNKKRIKKFHKDTLEFVCETTEEVTGISMLFRGSYLVVASENRLKRFNADLTFIDQSVVKSGNRVMLSGTNTYILYNSNTIYAFDLDLNFEQTRTDLSGIICLDFLAFNVPNPAQLHYTGISTNVAPTYTPYRGRNQNGDLYGFGTFGSLLGQLQDANEVIRGGDHVLTIADTGNNRIQFFGSFLAYEDGFGSYGVGNMQFRDPMSVAIGTIDYRPTPPDPPAPDGYEPPPPPPPDTHSVTFDWNEDIYDFKTQNPEDADFWINYTFINESVNYTYHLSIIDVLTGVQWYTHEINASNTSFVPTLVNSWCYYPRQQAGYIKPYNISSGLYEAFLDVDTFNISINIPKTGYMRFNQSVFDATGGTVNYSINYTTSYTTRKDCYQYDYTLFMCLDEECNSWTDVRSVPITPDNWSTGFYNGSFYPLDVDGWYFGGIQISDLAGNCMGLELTNEENATRLITPIAPTEYLEMDKTNYTVGDDFVLQYQCSDPSNTKITINWESTHLLTEGIFKYDTLLSSGSLYDTFTKPGEYNVILYSGCTQLYTKRVYVRESSNGIYIPDIIYHYQTNKDVDIIVSSITEDDLYVSIYSPDYHLIRTYEPAMIAYENGLAYIDYDLQPTDQSGLYFAHLRSSPAGTDIDTETFYARIGAYNVADGWFWDNNITQGDDMELCFYLPGNTNYSIFIKDMIGITVYMSFWNRSDINIPDSSFIRYETTSSIAIGNYTGICYNSAGTTVFNTTCKVNDDGYTPPTPTPTGIDAFINMIESAGFTGDIGKFAVAVVMILMCMYFLGRSIDSKLQIILSCLLVTAFCAIGFIPVWVLVIIGLVVAAVITFNFSKV